MRVDLKSSRTVCEVARFSFWLILRATLRPMPATTTLPHADNDRDVEQPLPSASRCGRRASRAAACTAAILGSCLRHRLLHPPACQSVYVCVCVRVRLYVQSFGHVYILVYICANDSVCAFRSFSLACVCDCDDCVCIPCFTSVAQGVIFVPVQK